MSLETLEVTNVRVIRWACLSVAPSLTLVCGPNGAGKTSLVEAINVLGTGRSFRSRRAAEIVTRGENCLRVVGTLDAGSRGGRGILGIEKQGAETRIRWAGREVRSASALARMLPMVLVPPDCQRVLTDGADLRRRLMDRSMFHVEPAYHGIHEAYRRALRQRNRVLRERGGAHALAPWDREVAEAGERLHTLRSRHLEGLLPLLSMYAQELCGMPVEVRYRRGWSQERPLHRVIEEHRARDRERGFSGSGPHRADLDVRVGSRPARDVVSRGEAKLLAVGLYVAQARQLSEAEMPAPLVLIDDLASELDEHGRIRIMGRLRDLGVQTVVTTLSRRAFPEGEWPPAAVFHVEQGEVTRVV